MQDIQKKCPYYKSPLQGIDEKKSFTKYGVKVDKKFLDDIKNNEYLSVDHIQFFTEMFMSMYPQQKVANFSTQFFLDFMPQLREQNPTPDQQPIQETQILEQTLKSQSNPQSRKRDDDKVVQENQSKSNNQKQQNDKQGEPVEQFKQNLQMDQEIIKNALVDKEKKESQKNQIEEEPITKTNQSEKKDNNKELKPHQQQAKQGKETQIDIEVINIEMEIEKKRNEKNKELIDQQTESQKNKVEPEVIHKKNQTNYPEKKDDKKDLTHQQAKQESQKLVQDQKQQIHVQEIEQEQYQWEKAQSNLNRKFQTQAELSQIEYFFFPIYYGNKHCISSIICKRQKFLIICDSMDRKNDEIISQGLICLALRSLQLQSPLKVLPALPKQQNNYDCGIFVLLSLLSVVHQNYVYDQEEVNKFRKYRLYNLALIGSQIDLKYPEFQTILED